MRVWACVAFIVLLILTTKHSALIAALEGLKLPKPLVTIWAMAFRYSILFLDMVYRKLRAIESRMFRRVSIGDLRRCLIYATGFLFLQAYERGEKVHRAMLSRGYGSGKPTKRTTRCTRRDCAFGLLCAALIGLAIAIERSLLP